MHGSSHTYILITMWLILTHKNSKELQHAFNSKLNGRLYTIYTCILFDPSTKELSYCLAIEHRRKWCHRRISYLETRF